jgi:hypothetical protein
MTINLRQESDGRATTKGSALTFQELDNNFIDLLNRATLTVEDDSNTQIVLGNDGTVTAELKVVGAGGLTTSVGSDSTGQAVLTLTQSAGGISNVVEDTTPQLGGELDGQDNTISAVELKDYKETIYDLGTTDTPSLTVSNGNVQTLTITSGLTLPEFTDAEPGQTITLLVSGSGSVSGSTSSAGNEYLFAGGNKTLTNDSIVSIVFDGGNYLCSIATDFQV